MTFNEWVESLPQSHWAKYDLSACKVGWEARDSEVEQIKLQLAEVCKNIGISGQLAKHSTLDQLGALAAAACKQ